MEPFSKLLYRIEYQNGSHAYLQIDAMPPNELDQPFNCDAPRTASYGPSATKLAACQVIDPVIDEDVLALETAYGHLFHETGKPPEWYTDHHVQIIEAPSDAEDPRMNLPGSILCEIQLDKEVVYFCLLEGYKEALYGPDLESMKDSKLLKEVEVHRDGGTKRVASEHGWLYIPSPVREEVPIWSIPHTIELQDN